MLPHWIETGQYGRDVRFPNLGAFWATAHRMHSVRACGGCCMSKGILESRLSHVTFLKYLPLRNAQRECCGYRPQDWKIQENLRTCGYVLTTTVSFFWETPLPQYPKGDGGRKSKWFEDPQPEADLCQQAQKHKPFSSPVSSDWPWCSSFSHFL